MTQMAINLVESADIDLECVQEQIAAARKLMVDAKTNAYEAACAQQRSGDEIGARKLFNLYDQVNTQISSLDKLQKNVGERRGQEWNPDCVCGYSSNCPVHPR